MTDLTCLLVAELDRAAPGDWAFGMTTASENAKRWTLWALSYGEGWEIEVYGPDPVDVLIRGTVTVHEHVDGDYIPGGWLSSMLGHSGTAKGGHR